ncbi:MAG: hypothetical protein FJ031_00300 [Chloroflexi bacterium]|nr:hypothetical protein [Chloroflexota bacterium]
MFRNSIIVRLIAAALLIGLLAAGGYTAYRAGVSQGIALAPEVAEAIQQQGVPVAPMVGYGYPQSLGYHHFNPFGAICFSIFFLFLFFGLLKMIFFRRMRHGWSHHSHWKKDWEGGVPPMFDEWHKRAHEVPVGGGEQSTGSEEK